MAASAVSCWLLVVATTLAAGGLEKGIAPSLVHVSNSQRNTEALNLPFRPLDFELNLSSERDSRKGFFEGLTCATVDDIAIQTRYWQFDDDGNVRTYYTPAKLPYVGRIAIDQREFILDSTYCWQRREIPPWSFVWLLELEKNANGEKAEVQSPLSHFGGAY